MTGVAALRNYVLGKRPCMGRTTSLEWKETAYLLALENDKTGVEPT
jgi:hypothetical protein